LFIINRLKNMIFIYFVVKIMTKTDINCKKNSTFAIELMAKKQ
jgi:hypothetical protein